MNQQLRGNQKGKDASPLKSYLAREQRSKKRLHDKPTGPIRFCGICGTKHGTNEPHKIRELGDRNHKSMMTKTGTDFGPHVRSKRQLKPMNLGLSRDKLITKRMATPSSDGQASLSMPIPKAF